MIRMVNQTGDGYADAYSETEAQSYEAKGWKRFVPPSDEPTEDAPKKRGRPAKAAE